MSEFISQKMLNNQFALAITRLVNGFAVYNMGLFDINKAYLKNYNTF